MSWDVAQVVRLMETFAGSDRRPATISFRLRPYPRCHITEIRPIGSIPKPLNIGDDCFFILPLLILFFTFFIAAHAAEAAGAEGDKLLPYNDGIGEVVRLSNQTDRPFLFIGHNLEKTEWMAPRYLAYKQHIELFRGVNDCLLEPENLSEQPKLTEFNWKAHNVEKSLEVCLFRLADSYREPKDFYHWMESQNLMELKMYQESVDDHKILTVAGYFFLDEKKTLGKRNGLSLQKLPNDALSDRYRCLQLRRILARYDGHYNLYSIDIYKRKC